MMIRLAKQIVASKTFSRFIVGVILLAGVLAGLETDAGLRARCGGLLHLLDKIILGIFVLEIALKVVAHGRRPLDFFRDGWNVFDFIIVAVCLLPVQSQFLAVMRVARALRLLRLVSALPKLQLLVGALLKSLSAMGYVSLLLALLFYIYAVAGVHLFGTGEAEHFRNLPNALITLFQIVTLDNWGDIFNAQRGHVEPVKLVVYFVSFIVVGTMIILNLFIGIIMNSMAEMHAEIAEGARALQEQEGGPALIEDEFKAAERQLKELQEQLAVLRHRCSSRD